MTAAAGARSRSRRRRRSWPRRGARSRTSSWSSRSSTGRPCTSARSESRSLAYAREQHKQVPAAIRKLQETLQQTSGIADELSGRVRKLDAVCGRVGEALKLQAAQYVARFRASQDALPPGTDEASVRVLREAEAQLSALVRQRFEGAMAAKDSAGVSRFAKLFHPLGLAGEGVQKYVEFIRKSLAEQCALEFRQLAPPSFGKKVDAEPMPYEKAIRSVYLAIADIVQEHQESVENEFGPENFIVVVRGLLDEVDVQGIRVLERFFKDNAKVFQQQATEMQEVGAVLDETAVITQRTQQFDTYIRNVAEGVVELIADKEVFVKSLPQGYNEQDGLPQLSKLVHRVQELVSSYPAACEQSFLLRSVEKAIRAPDSLDPNDAEQLTTTLVDDAFFVMSTSLGRSISSCEINAVCAMVNHVNAALGGELKSALVRNLSESKSSYSNWVTYPQNLAPAERGQHPLATLFVDQEGRPRASLTAADSWPHALNDLQQCVGYVDKLRGGAFDEWFPSEGPDKDKRVMFEHCIGTLDATKVELENEHAKHCKDGLNLLKKHLQRTLVPLDTLDYDIDEAQYNDYQVNDPFARSFSAQAEVLHAHLRSVLNPASCDEILSQMAEQTCRRIEKAALSKRFSLFGALQFESDVRALCSFFTSVSEQALRHKFARLFEMSSLLSLEGVEELRDICGELRSWRLSPEEIRTLLEARTDFDATQRDLNMLLPA
ncbi:unnamed protein product [Prorocentrum cordatum]|uniref:COG4 transport protein middle alpha-helical bundle domain-containing protein n=1 Tax=Prorocentrum cordatum TaxID=2364126 RepID=A0ABN9X7C0_9DINO|nr:unnamed protein product [Polarella glacialis]